MTILSEGGPAVLAIYRSNSAIRSSLISGICSMFKVKVKAVNTIQQKGKTKLFRGRPYQRSDVKKAVVTLQEGYQIDITTGL